MADFGTFTGGKQTATHLQTQFLVKTSNPIAAYFAFVDASLSFIPATIFWSLQISSHQKATLSTIFALNVL
jgi:hypothetical protein